MLCIYDKEGYWWCAVFYLLLSCIIVTRLWISLHSLIGTHYPHWYILTFTCIVSKYVILVSYFSWNVIIRRDIVFLAKSIIELRNMGCKNEESSWKLLPPIYQNYKILQKNYYILRKNNYRINDIGSKLGCYFLYDITFKNE